jgi:CheY-like chemotaxis protein
VKKNITDSAVIETALPAAGIQKLKLDETESVSEGSLKDVPRKNVLLVEDDDFSAFFTVQILKRFCEIDLTETGEDALEMVRKKKYDMILMDIGLRGISGVEAASCIRKISEYENVPIVALTAYAMSGDKESILNGGCSHYLSKPFGVKDLLSLVREVFKI